MREYDTEFTFGTLLREHRLAANLTQAALAEEAGISIRAIQDLERSLSQPHRDTVLRLIGALGLSAEEQVGFFGAAKPRPRRKSSGLEQSRTEAAPAIHQHGRSQLSDSSRLLQEPEGRLEAPPIHYVTTSDGYDIAYAVEGEGRPFVFMPQPISHIQIYWTRQTWVLPWYHGLAARFRLVQYDSRGQGLSTRGLPDHFSLNDLETDLQAVVERVGLQRFVLMAVHSSGHVALRYASQHPERVEALVLVSCGLSLRDWEPVVMRPMADQDWDAYLRVQAALTRVSDLAAGIQRQKDAVRQADWSRLMQAALASRIADCIPSLRTPTLVLHPRESLNFPPEESMRLAAAIPGALRLLIDGATPLGDHVQGLQAIDDFLAGLPPTHGPSLTSGEAF